MPDVVRCMSREAVNQWMFRDGGIKILDRVNMVSCLDSGLASPFVYSIYRQHIPSLLTLHFDDLGNTVDWNHDPEDPGYAPFTMDHADRLYRWFRRADKTKPFVAHCWAGISRSGAIGLWMNRQLGNADEAFYASSPQARPNPDVLANLKAITKAYEGPH